MLIPKKLPKKKLIYRNEDDKLVVDESLDGNKVVLYEDDDIKVETTGHFYDFIATVSNFGTKCTLIFTGDAEYVEDFTVDGNDWIGLLADETGWDTLEAIVNGDFRVEREDDFDEIEEDEILATLKSTNISSVDLDREFCNRVLALIEGKNEKIEDLEKELKTAKVDAENEFAEKVCNKLYENIEDCKNMTAEDPVWVNRLKWAHESTIVFIKDYIINRDFEDALNKEVEGDNND